MVTRPHSVLGFSLAEVVITVFLVGMVLGIMANLLGGANRVMRYSEMRERSYIAAQQALDRVSCELREAVSIDAVGTGITFTKIDPTQPFNEALLPVPPADPPPLWSPAIPGGYPYPAGSRLQIRYWSNGNNLFRSINGGSQHLVVEGIVGLTSSQPAVTEQPGIVDLSIGVAPPNGPVQSVTTTVTCMGVYP